MIDSGRFNTTTKVKISTQFGTILKVTHYNIDEDPYDEYRIRPKCSKCGGDVGCVCYNYNNSDDPEQSAIDGLQSRWVCDKIHCLYEYMKEYTPEKYNKMKAIYGDDEWSIVEALQDEMQEDDNGIFCEV